MGSREEEDGQQYFGLSLREMVYQYKWQMLVLFKCLLLQPKVGLAWQSIRWVHTNANDR